jgi:hypothetical protein
MSLHRSLKEKSESFIMPRQEENYRCEATERGDYLAEHQPASSCPMHRPIIKVFIVYETDLNRDRAQFMREELTRRLGQSFAFSVSWWSLESLGDTETQKVAAHPLAEADIICFSLLSGGELPQNVTKWIEKGLFERKANNLLKPSLIDRRRRLPVLFGQHPDRQVHPKPAAGQTALLAGLSGDGWNDRAVFVSRGEAEQRNAAGEETAP